MRLLPSAVGYSGCMCVLCCRQWKSAEASRRYRRATNENLSKLQTPPDVSQRYVKWLASPVASPVLDQTDRGKQCSRCQKRGVVFGNATTDIELKTCVDCLDKLQAKRVPDNPRSSQRRAPVSVVRVTRSILEDTLTGHPIHLPKFKFLSSTDAAADNAGATSFQTTLFGSHVDEDLTTRSAEALPHLDFELPPDSVTEVLDIIVGACPVASDLSLLLQATPLLRGYTKSKFLADVTRSPVTIAADSDLFTSILTVGSPPLAMLPYAQKK